MGKIAILPLVLAASVLATTTLAQENTDASTREELVLSSAEFPLVQQGWFCEGSRGALFDLRFENQGIRISNISITLVRDFITNRTVLKLSASAINTTPQRGIASLEAYGLSIDADGVAKMVFAMNAREYFGSINPGASQDLSATI